VADRSAIEWTDATWNPITGCSKVSPGCAHCYAETLSLRYGWSKKPWTPENARENVVLHPERLGVPLRWREPRMVFVNSMSDLFHEEVSFGFILKVFLTMRKADRHVFQVLTKRPERMAEFMSLHAPIYGVAPNVWLGVSIENSRFTWRADVLREIPAAVRFISAEPLLGSLYPAQEEVGIATMVRGSDAPQASSAFNDTYPPPRAPLSLDGIDWLIAGGESGPSHRPLNVDHVRELRDACVEAGVPFFFKQVGGRTPKAGGKLLDGREWCEMPRRVVLA
jgi:protein gp37